jgi:hypothetical protein
MLNVQCLADPAPAKCTGGTGERSMSVVEEDAGELRGPIAANQSNAHSNRVRARLVLAMTVITYAAAVVGWLGL